MFYKTMLKIQYLENLKLAIVILICSCLFACTKETEIVTCTDTNYIPNEAGTDCICPNETHFLVENAFDTLFPSLPRCEFRASDRYYVVASGEHCFNSGDFIAFDELGMGILDTENYISIMQWGGILNLRAKFPSASKIEQQDDGSVLLEYDVYAGASIQCYDWREKTDCPHNIFGKVIGVSNSDQSEFNFTINWTDDCTDEILGTGTIRMWRDW